jgi:hypothetical protein
MEPLQSLGNGHANERKPQPNRQYKIDLPSHTASAWQAIGDSRTPNATRSPRRIRPLADETPRYLNPATLLSSIVSGLR